MTASPTWPRLWPGISSEAGLVTQDTATGLLRKNGLKDGYGVLAALEAGGYLEVLGPGDTRPIRISVSAVGSATSRSNWSMVSIMDSQAKERARVIFLSEQMGLIRPSDLPEFATELLVLGYDSPSLRELAGLPKSDRANSADLWNGVREEFSIPAEDKEEAATFLLRYWAQETVQGRIDVVAGARLMYRVAWFPLGQPEGLNDLVYLLDVWDEMPHRREQTASELLAFARNLVGGT